MAQRGFNFRPFVSPESMFITTKIVAVVIKTNEVVVCRHFFEGGKRIASPFCLLWIISLLSILCLEVTGSFTSSWFKDKWGSPGVNNRTELGVGGGSDKPDSRLSFSSCRYQGQATPPLSLDFFTLSNRDDFPTVPTSQGSFQDQMRRLSTHALVCYDQGLTR